MSTSSPTPPATSPRPGAVRSGVTVGAVFGGIAISVFVHAVAAAILVLGSLLGGAVVEDPRDPVAEAPPEEVPLMDFVEARFVRLGREFEPRELPNLVRPTTAPPPNPGLAETPTASSMRVDPETRNVDEPPRSVERLLDDLQESAAALADEDGFEQEGSPDGVIGGEDVDGDALQRYLGQLTMFFRRGFVMPNIPESEREGLGVLVQVEISDVGVVTSFAMSSSGNAEFDQAVRLRMEQAEGANVPNPPTEAVRAEVFGKRHPVRMVPPR